MFLKKYLFMEKKSEKLFNISLANDFPWLLFFFCCNVDIEFWIHNKKSFRQYFGFIKGKEGKNISYMKNVMYINKDEDIYI